jgi:3-isopropylmalate dehydrogenase
MGLVPSAAISDDGVNIYEPVHGSAPDIAGRDVANPIATILCLALILQFSAGRPDLAEVVQHAVDLVLSKGRRTRDIVCGVEGEQVVSCSAMGALIASAVAETAAR